MEIYCFSPDEIRQDRRMGGLIGVGESPETRNGGVC
jgi:hypothetical protein